MKLLLLYPFLAVLLSASCGSTKEAPKSTAPETSKNNSAATGTGTNSSTSTTGTTTETTSTTGTMTAVTPGNTSKIETNYRLIVSFISIGEGIDSKARETMDSMINSWKEKRKIDIAVEIMPWGREGEADYCFKLNELNSQDQEGFVSEVKSVFKGNSLVQIAENQEARHKR